MEYLKKEIINFIQKRERERVFFVLFFKNQEQES